MKTKNLLLILGISSLPFFANNLQAQTGTDDNNTQTSNQTQDELNSQRLYNLEQQVKDANERVRDARGIEKEAKAAAKEAKSALKAEKQAQKARKQANAQAKKARKAMD